MSTSPATAETNAMMAIASAIAEKRCSTVQCSRRYRSYICPVTDAVGGIVVFYRDRHAMDSFPKLLLYLVLLADRVQRAREWLRIALS